MRAGELRHQVLIERLSDAAGSDDYGQPITTWEAVGTFPASVTPLNGREFMAAQMLLSEITAEIRIRYQAGITVLDRVTHGATVYNIKSVINPDMRNEELALMCKAIS